MRSWAAKKPGSGEVESLDAMGSAALGSGALGSRCVMTSSLSADCRDRRQVALKSSSSEKLEAVKVPSAVCASFALRVRGKSFDGVAKASIGVVECSTKCILNAWMDWRSPASGLSASAKNCLKSDAVRRWWYSISSRLVP